MKHGLGAVLCIVTIASHWRGLDALARLGVISHQELVSVWDHAPPAPPRSCTTEGMGGQRQTACWCVWISPDALELGRAWRKTEIILLLAFELLPKGKADSVVSLNYGEELEDQMVTEGHSHLEAKDIRGECLLTLRVTCGS